MIHAMKNDFQKMHLNIEQGGYAHTVKTSVTNRIRVDHGIRLYKGDTLLINPGTRQCAINAYLDYGSTTIIQSLDFFSVEKSFTVEQDCICFISIRKDSNNTSIVPTDWDGSILLSYDRYNPKFEIGGWSGSTRVNATDRIRTIQKIPYETGQSISLFIPSLDYYINFLAYDITGTYISSASHIIIPYWYTYGTWSTTNTNITHFTIMLVHKDSSKVLTENDLVKLNKDIKISIGEEKQTLVYKFGGNGNDYCFVRLPQGYDSNRIKPYPFVICNHGNGWEMDGSLEKANWTKRTMYVPLDDSDYIANPTQYNGTGDSSLWYSNPTIEALLDAGYIVCGCQNYGDNLYGNEKCRQACVDFYNHMQKIYNVEEGCYMIGASNGAQTCINAVYLLGEKIKGMILQYPLTCLVNQYNNYQNHQSAIRTAFEISSSSPTEEQLLRATATHDFLHTDIVDGIKIGYFPPTKLYYSLEDTVTNANYNAIPFYNCLRNSYKRVAYVECSGQHGDASHFDPDAYVSFFNNH